MEVTVATWEAVSLVLVSIVARWVWGILDWLWFKPKKLERLLREQGLKGNTYRFMYGDLKENANLLEQASSKPMNLSTSHDIAPRLIPFLDQTVKTYGKNSFLWNGPVPRVTIMNPEEMKDVFTKLDDFRRPPANPLVKLLATGVASYEGEKWFKHRRIINPTFQVEKLKKVRIQRDEKGEMMSSEDVIEECKLFYFAGQETTSVLLVWTMILLCQNQNWQDRARQEVLQVFGSNKPDFDGLTHLKVVTMVLLEVLRLYPALVLITRNTAKETQLGKFSLPAGVQVSLPTLLIHRDKELWGDDANEFNPERFSEGISKATKSPISFFPFGGGPRICIGQNLATLEAKLALSLILQHFHFELSPSYADAPSPPMIRPQYGAPIILQKR